MPWDQQPLQVGGCNGGGLTPVIVPLHVGYTVMATGIVSFQPAAGETSNLALRAKG